MTFSRLVSIILVGILTSCYFFPFEFTFLPGINTKMMLAAISLIILVTEMVNKPGKVEKDFLILSVIASIFSLMCFAAVIINGKNDHTYSTYIISMWVWLGGAYTVVTAIKRIHGYVSIQLLCNYLISVCVVQCILALIIDYSPFVKNLVNSIVHGFDFVGLDRLGDSERLYGIGAALDVAGTRFSTVLIMISAMTVSMDESKGTQYIPMYLIAFIVIAIVGNMIARTTTVGLILAILYWILVRKPDMVKNKSKVFLYLSVLLVCLIPYLVYLYETNLDFRSQITFAFEGFFSLAETGEWDVNSTNNLKNMVIFPETLKTWLIGDGYLENPRVTDPYYIGPVISGYYKGTDIGYLRFIFYFGIFTLMMFVFFFYKAAKVCVDRFPSYSLMFWFILLVNYIVWLKVSTDIFVVLALFLCVGFIENGNNKEIND